MPYSDLAIMVLCANIPLSVTQKTSETSETNKQSQNLLERRPSFRDLPQLETKLEKTKENIKPQDGDGVEDGDGDEDGKWVLID
jgi:hypothetical protein